MILDPAGKRFVVFGGWGRLGVSTFPLSPPAASMTSANVPDGPTWDGGIAPDAKKMTAWRSDLDTYGQQYRADPSKVDAALRYAQALRATGQRAQAVAVLERVSMEHPRDKAVLGEYGRALAEAGNYEQALEVMRQPGTNHPGLRCRLRQDRGYTISMNSDPVVRTAPRTGAATPTGSMHDELV